MSLLGLQSAITKIIRLPKDNRGDLEQLLGSFDLTAAERDTVANLSNDAELNKYGNELADQRWDRICRKIGVLFSFLKREWLEGLWFSEFEPMATKLESDMAGGDAFTIAFLEYLLEDPAAHAQIRQQGMPFVDDLIRYLRAECFVRRLAGNDKPLPADSLLKHRAVQILRLDFDIPTLVQSLYAAEPSTDQTTELYPEERQVTVLMLLDEGREFRIFEIEPLVGDFIESQLEGTRSEALTDEYYQQMVTLGLCHQRG